MPLPRPLANTGVRSPSYRSNGREMFSPRIVTQAKRTSEYLFLVFCFVVLTNPVLAYPRKRPPVKLNNITEITIPRCRPVDPEHLRYRMGKNYDPARMAMNEDEMKKRSNLEERSIEDEDDDDFEEGSEFGARDVVDNSDSNIDSISKTMLRDGRYSPDTRTQDSAYLDSMKFMRRRKRSAVVGEDLVDEDEEEEEEDVTFYQRIMQLTVRHKRGIRNGGRRRKHKIKRKNPVMWKCKMRKIWNKTKPGYFPKFYNSVECVSKKCYYNLNECIEQGYTITLFKLDPDRCNPVPTVGLNSTYEEVWIQEKQHVNVWCECGNPRNKRRRKNRRRRPRAV